MLDQTKEIITEMEEIEWGITSKEKLKNIYTTFFIGHDKNIVQFDLKRNQDKYLEILKRIILTRSFVVENWVDSEEKDDDDDDDDSLDIDYLSKRKRTPKLIKKKKKKTNKIKKKKKKKKKKPSKFNNNNKNRYRYQWNNKRVIAMYVIWRDTPQQKNEISISKNNREK